MLLVSYVFRYFLALHTQFLLFIATEDSVFLMIAILIPRQETMYKMLVATYITPDNIGAVQSNVVEFIGRVAEQLVKLKK